MGTLDNATTRTQAATIRRHLLEVGWIDKTTALSLCDCERLGARIWDLRNDPDDPMDIVTDWKFAHNRFGHTVRVAVYRLRREVA